MIDRAAAVTASLNEAWTANCWPSALVFPSRCATRPKVFAAEAFVDGAGSPHGTRARLLRRPHTARRQASEHMPAPWYQGAVDLSIDLVNAHLLHRSPIDAGGFHPDQASLRAISQPLQVDPAGAIALEPRYETMTLSVPDHLQLIDEHTTVIDEITARIEVVIEPFRGARDLIVTIPGISTVVADVIIAETGA